MNPRVESTSSVSLSDHQQEIVRAVVAGRMKRYVWPGQWCAFLERQEVVVQNDEDGWTLRVPLR